MRPWFPLLAGAVFYAFSLVWAAGELPADGVPLHFDPAGVPTAFGSRAGFLTLAALFGLLVAGTGSGLHRLVTTGPLTRVSVPHREHWMRPQRVGRLRRMLAEDMGRIFGATLLLLTAVPVATVYATRAQPPRLPVGPVWVVLTLLVAGIVGYCVYLTRHRYRPT
ncbi:DUF1648 domain-containing protein [Pseudonocardia sp. HH130629-09]|uniref:DUF1648 domain-containing protein n=1 Tax=Pseudonocardia sp. HH130629-09 TaxID=1641402 RepID=UPI0011AE1BB8|nr:DUF1648 domain-containing protein [Pseudonocardia sp. HH130629-09]